MSQKMQMEFLENGPAIMTLPHGRKMAICRCGASDTIACNGNHAKLNKTTAPSGIVQVECTEEECNIIFN